MADSTIYDESESIFSMRSDGSFNANTKGIIEKKAEFFNEAREFLFLRKGEDVGIEIIGFMSFAINVIADPLLADMIREFIFYENVLRRINRYYQKIKQIIESRKKEVLSPPKDLRIILCPDRENTEAKPIYEAQGYQIKSYENELIKGPFRYYLNEKRYCLFLRTGKDTFTGFIGNNSDTINELKISFENEWQHAKDF